MTSARHDIDRYLWDRSGPPDPEIQLLEEALARYRAPERPVKLGPETQTERTPPRAARARLGAGLAAAAALLLASVGAWFGARNSREVQGWKLETLAGSPSVRAASLPLGQWMTTDNTSRARLEVGGLGDVTVEPGSRVRIKESANNRRVLELSEGTIGAFILAPPRLFLVDPPAARAVDLGCKYTLHVDRRGAGVLRVTLGFVELVGAGRTSTVARGASCAIDPARGPGTPLFDDAPPELASALSRIDAGQESKDDLDRALSSARERDAASLWHLLPRTTGSHRDAVYERLAMLSPPPRGVGRSQVLALDETALRRWWTSIAY